MRSDICRKSAAAGLVVLTSCSIAPAAPFDDKSAAKEVRRFVDVSREAGLPVAKSRSWGASWADYDLDGDPDLLLGRHWRAASFLESDLARLTSADGVRGLEKKHVDRHSCAWGEADGDGSPDLYCARGADRGKGAGANQLFVQSDSGLTNIAARMGVTDEMGRGRSVNWLDYDGDQDLDLFVGNMVRPGAPNVMLTNTGGSYEQIDVGVEEELSTASSSWSDWDGDRDPDLLVLQHLPHRPAAYLNDHGWFRRIELPRITNRRWLSAAWGDYDGDGFQDLHLVAPERSVVLHNRRGNFELADKRSLTEGRASSWLDADNDGDLDAFVIEGARGEDTHPLPGEPNRPDSLLINDRGIFRHVLARGTSGTAIGNGDGVAVTDFDRDGRLDVLVTNGYLHWAGPPVLLRNRYADGEGVLLLLRGKRSNPLGIGARVQVRAGNLRYWRHVTDGVVFKSQSEPGVVHLGLARSVKARARIVWPDGTVDCLRVFAGDVVTVLEGTRATSCAPKRA